MPEKNNAASDWNPTAAASECDAIVTQEVSKVEVFDNDEFGQLRVTRDASGEPWFSATDVAKALGIRELLDGPCSAKQVLACMGCALVALGALLTIGLLLS